MASASDFTPVEAPASKPAASDFTPIQASDFTPVTEAPAPAHAEHGALPFDDIIVRKAKQYGIPEDFALKIGKTETGGVHDRARAVSSAGAGGVYQLMPGTAKELGVKDIFDPEQNIDGGMRYLAQFYKKYKGNLADVAGAYNMGPGAYDEYLAGKRHLPEETRNYLLKAADFKVPDNAPPDHKFLEAPGIQHVQKVIQRFTQLQKDRKDPWQALAKDKALRPLHNAEADVARNHIWLQDHPAEGFFDILSSGQRAVAGLMDNANYNGGVAKAFHKFLENDVDRKDMIHRVSDYVFHPNAKVIGRSSEAVADFVNDNTGIHVPSHDEIDQYVQHHVWTPFQKPSEALVKGSRDLALQTVSDPLTYAGGVGLWEKGIQAGNGVAKIMFHLMQADLKKGFLHLDRIGDTMAEAGSKTFGIRRDLDAAGFTRDGKKIRISIENSGVTRHNKIVRRAQEVAHDPQVAADHYVDTLKKNTNVSQMSKAMQKYHSDAADEIEEATTSPERRIELTTQMSQQLKNEHIGKETRRIFSNPNGTAVQKYYMGDPGKLHSLNLQEDSKMQKMLDNAPDFLQHTRNLGKKAITWNPLPHGVKNVGINAWMAGGPMAVVRGIGGMFHPIEQHVADRLTEMGAVPDYLGDHAADAYTKFQENSLAHMELSWRAGLMETLDKHLGVPKTDEEKYMRGYMINQKIGDYRNQSAFVKFFQALGGPFVAFRLGITPKVVMQTLAEHPERIEQLMRPVQDIQNDRSTPGKYDNEVQMGGGVDDMAKLIADPERFAQRSLGVLNQDNQQVKGVGEMLLNLGNQYFSPAQAAEQAQQLAAGVERPLQDVTLQDRLMDAFLQAFGVYYSKEATPKQENLKYKKSDKEIAF